MFGAWLGAPGLPVVALPGWRRTHEDFVPVLSGDLGGLALDLPGFGASPPPPLPWGARDYAGLVARVLSEASWSLGARAPTAAAGGSPAASPFVVVGHSFGGQVAVRLALEYPDLVSALVLTGAPLVARAGAAPGVPLVLRVARRLHSLGLVKAAKVDAYRERYGSPDYRAASGVMRAVLVRAIQERPALALELLSCPVYLIWGSEDGEVPLTLAREIERRIRGSRLQVVEGVGHMLPSDAPARLQETIAEALDRVGVPVRQP